MRATDPNNLLRSIGLLSCLAVSGFGASWGAEQIERSSSFEEGVLLVSTPSIATPLEPALESIWLSTEQPPTRGTASPNLSSEGNPNRLQIKKRRWDPNMLGTLQGCSRGDPIRFELPSGEVACGMVQVLKSSHSSVAHVSGTLIQPEPGRFFFHKQSVSGVAGEYVGIIEFPASNRAYRIEPIGPAGAPELVEHTLQEVLCASLPRPPASGKNRRPKIPPLNPAQYPDLPIPSYQNGIETFESLPGALAVIYLDFQGGYTGTWGGVGYDRPDVSNGQIREVWQRVAEHFMPFSIDVTTDLRVFQLSTNASRQHVIITPTETAASDAAGAAYEGSFNWDFDMPCWVFVTSGKSCADICAHEVGHTLGLSHDGQNYGPTHFEYFAGQGTGDTGWAPIMGEGFFENVSQWCQGEYLYANNQQDQLLLITSQNNNVGYRIDDTGDTLATSRYLELYADYTASAQGVIERTEDTDAFQFTTGGGQISLRADPVSEGPDLAIQVGLYDSQDRPLAISNPQDTLWAALSTNVLAGTYTFRVTGAGRNSTLTNGFSSYASLGYYAITGSVVNARLPDRFSLPEHSTNGTVVGVVAAGSNQDPLIYSIVSGNTGNTFTIDDSGTLRVGNNSLLSYVTLGGNSQLPVQFELFADITDTLHPSLSETNRRVVVAITFSPVPPIISGQPQNVTAPAGTDATFSLLADGQPPLSYQWLFDGMPIPDEASSILTLTNVQSTSAGQYQAVVSSLYGSTTSAVVVLSVGLSSPVVTRQPKSQGIFPGFSAGFITAAAGTDPLGYQWQLNGTNLQGATNALLWFPGFSPNNQGVYQAIITNSVGTTNTASALLAMVPVAAWGWEAYGRTNLTILLTNAVEVSAGGVHSLALCRDGTVVSWGGFEQSTVPAGVSNVVAVAAGGSHSLALTADGHVVAWGNNTAGQTSVPADLSNVVAIAAGDSHSLALKSDGTISAWGSASSGQTIVPDGLTNVIAISAGYNHSLALTADGNVVGFGDNAYGEIVAPTNATDVVAIAAGLQQSLALRLDGTVAVWGNNNYEQASAPAGLTGMVAIAAGSYDSLALNKDGTVVGWGAGTQNSSFPYLGQSLFPPTITNVGGISAGPASTVIVTGEGPPFIVEPPIGRIAQSGGRVVFRARATGSGPLMYQWQLDGTNIAGATGSVLVITNVPAENAGDYRIVVANALGLTASSAARLGVTPQLPFIVTQPASQTLFLGSQANLSITAVGSGQLAYQWRFNGQDIPGGTNAMLTFDRVNLTQAGEYSVIVSSPFGTAVSVKAQVTVLQVAEWGLGTNGQSALDLGQQPVPSGLTGVVRVAGGMYHSLALKNDGTVVGWLVNPVDGPSARYYDYGQANVPNGLNGVVDIAAGGYHSVALKADGTVVAWGAGITNSYTTPERGQSMVPPSLQGVIAIAAGDLFSAALTSLGRVIVWGNPNNGPPIVPSPVTNIVAIAGRGPNLFALRSDGALLLWGGVSSTPTVSNVVEIAVSQSDWGVQTTAGSVLVDSIKLQTFSNIVQLAAGYTQWLARQDDGSVQTWGTSQNPALLRVPAGITSAIDVAGGKYHSLAALGDGSIVLKVPIPDRSAMLGGRTLFRAMAGGALPLTYQWEFNGADLAGATNSWLWLTNLQASDAGSYRVVAANRMGIVTSEAATLSVVLPVAGLDSSGLTWTTSGDAPWFDQTNITHNGNPTAQSGHIGDSQHSTLQTFVNGPGTLTFWWKVSSEQYYDYLNFYIDGELQAAISGEVDWQSKTLAIQPGLQKLTWTYAKDPTISVGLDAGWLSQVSFVPAPPFIAAQPLGETVSMGATIDLSLTAYGASPMTYEWLKDGTNLLSAGLPSLTISNASRRDSGVYSAVVSNPGGRTPSSNAVVIVRVPQKLSPPGQLGNGSFVLLSADADGGALLPGDLPAFVAQTSSNLMDWTILVNGLTLSNGNLLLVDPGAGNSQTRFYRILEQ